jgi:hypothetical protein
MKKKLALIIVVGLLAMMVLPLSALAWDGTTYIGEVTMEIPDMNGLTITISDAASEFGYMVAGDYGTYNLIVAAPDATMTFESDVTFGNSGVDAGSYKAGDVINFSDVNGYYIYDNGLGSGGSLYTIFATTQWQYWVAGTTENSLTFTYEEYLASGTIEAPPHDYSLFGGSDGRLLLWCVVFGLGFSVPLAIIVFIAQRKETKSGGVKYAGMGRLADEKGRF